MLQQQITDYSEDITPVDLQKISKSYPGGKGGESYLLQMRKGLQLMWLEYQCGELM